ncbi:MAG TPA: VCBS repeat-containing protein, partial [Anaerolineae bacterium]|nr:VCBS repeat-containing protein [Anaerolineae bacterium]
MLIITNLLLFFSFLFVINNQPVTATSLPLQIHQKSSTLPPFASNNINTPPTFTTQLISTAISSTNTLAWGDSDGDGDLDLAVGNNGQNELYLNDGKGNFTLGAFPTDSQDTTSVAWGDIDGDGDLDLAVGNFNQPNQLYRNDNDGNFSLASFPLDIRNTTSLALGDVDGDGDLDLAIGNLNQQNQLYLNNGAGTFTLGSFPNDSSVMTRSIAWGDSDGDGDLDLAVGNENERNRIYQNDGSGNFSIGNFPNYIYPTYAVAWGDINGDGDLDLAFGNENERNRIYHNDGTGTFTIGSFPTDMNTTRSIAWGDNDGDGDLDLLVSNFNQPYQIYKNNGAGGFSLDSYSSDSPNSKSIAWGDVDSDGDLDFIVGNYGQENQLYINDAVGKFIPTSLAAPEDQPVSSIAWGDADGDGDLDLAIATDSLINHLYTNDGTGNFSRNLLDFTANTTSIAWGDADGDGDLDLAIGRNNYENKLYINDGTGNFSSRTVATTTYKTYAIAWGDADGDGDLDLATGNNNGQQNQLYLNNGEGRFSLAPLPADADNTRAIAWGDIDNDGDLDFATGNANHPNRLYINDGLGNFNLTTLSPDANNTYSLAWGDADGDGDLDLAVGNYDNINRLYINDGLGNFSLTIFSPSTDNTYSIAWGDADGDGDLDLAVGNHSQDNRLYINDGTATFSRINIPSTSSSARAVAWGDADGDGDLDLAIGNYRQNIDEESEIYINPRHSQLTTIPTAPFYTSHIQPILPTSQHLPPANGYTQHGSFDTPIIPISYTLNHSFGLSATAVQGYYSFNGGGQWFPATAATPTTNAPIPSNQNHTYYWDLPASGVFGSSDNVLFRLEPLATASTPIVSPTMTYPHQAAGPILYGKNGATTTPFRVTGPQIRVYSGTITTTAVISNAIVYRLPAGYTTGAVPLINSANQPLRTDSYGFLQGQGQIHRDDKIIALLPITTTENYTVYYTSAPVTLTGLDFPDVTTLGARELVVQANNPLIIFNFDVSLEWDASNDGLFLTNLEDAIRRSSDVLFDVTNGQVLLGQVNIYQNRQNWHSADLHIYAANDIHPAATLGGVVDDAVHDIGLTGVITNAYRPGIIRMGSNWDPFGENQADLTQDWWRALTHELGHYLLFMPDNYLGLDPNNGQLISTDCVGSFMTNSNDDAYSEFLPLNDWTGSCLNTIAAQTTGRPDWDTITHFYPWLNQPANADDNPGPGLQPLSLPTINTVTTATNTIPVRNFMLRDAATNQVVVRPQGRGYLLQTNNTPADLTDDALIPLGLTNAGGDRIKVRGAQPGDQLCLIDTSTPTAYLGCEDVTPTSASVPVSTINGWQPAITIQSPTTETLAITVTQYISPANLNVQAIPAYGLPGSANQITTTVGAFTVVDPANPVTFTALLNLDYLT